jgi:glutamine synthetase
MEIDEIVAKAENVALCVPDNAGRLIGKRLPVQRWPEVRASGMPMPNYHLVTGIENHPLEGLEVSGLHTGFPNGVLRPCEETMRLLPWEPHTAIVLCDAYSAAGELVEEAPRSILRCQVTRLEGLGLRAGFASELEFYLFRTSYAEAHRGNYRSLEPSYHRQADNDVLIAGYDEGFIRQIRLAMAALGIPINASQGEGGEGQHEVNLVHADPLTMADRHVLYKHGVKALAQAAGLSATFMAKIDPDKSGSSFHVHISLTDREGGSLMSKGADQLSPLGCSFLAGLLAFTPEMTLLHAPYANSYRRLQPGSFAPSNATWGWDNRTVMIRVVGDPKDLRFEFRVPGADANPYVSFAAILAAGIEGIEQALDPPSPIVGNAYDTNAEHLPADLGEAVALFAESDLAGRAFGAKVHRHLAALGGLERDAARRGVTDWDFRRGFESS